ncbi:hypothetical protein [Halovivax limisalsi]|uniref:hypothetical protein n=1 Tax=Halovivax limisalsi TaxID=1453760 RepID=UPI001FFD6C26|nr:hypothetical protein [Halovivax limisalsi]
MAEDDVPPSEPAPHPVAWIRRTLRSGWNDFRSVYYANTLIWRVFKSGALIFLGLFCWAGANLLLSYRPDWAILYYVLAYGFLLLFWGPFTHFVVVPFVIRIRRGGPDSRIERFLSRHGSKANLSIFFALVLILGTYPIGPMVFEFQLPSGGGGESVTAQLQCTKSAETVHCHLSDSRGIDSVVVTSGGERVERVADPPFEFNLEIDELEAVRGQEQFRVELKDRNGETLRTFLRIVDTIPGG